MPWWFYRSKQIIYSYICRPTIWIYYNEWWTACLVKQTGGFRSCGPKNITQLRWRHNGHVGVSNHQPHDCLLNRLFRHRSKTTSKLRVTGLCAGNSPGTGEFPAQIASYAENVSIWWRHHPASRPRRPSCRGCERWSYERQDSSFKVNNIDACDIENIVGNKKYIFAHSIIHHHLSSNLWYKTHISKPHKCWSLRCSWSRACRRCSTASSFSIQRYNEIHTCNNSKTGKCM